MGHRNLLRGVEWWYAESLQNELILDGECEVGTTVSPPGLALRPSHQARLAHSRRAITTSRQWMFSNAPSSPKGSLGPFLGPGQDYSKS